jgi:hypothetical protein
MILLKFLLKKYDIDYITEITYNYDDYFLHWKITENKKRFFRDLYVPIVFKNYIKESLRIKPKYIIIPVVLHDINSFYNVEEHTLNSKINQLVVFIYNTQTKIMEYFDPCNNHTFYDANLLPDMFEKYLNDNFPCILISKHIKVDKYINIQNKNINEKNVNEKIVNECNNKNVNENNFNKNNLGIQSIQESQLNEKDKKIGVTINLSEIYIIWFIEKRIVFEYENANTIIKKEIQKNKNLTVMILNYKNYLNEIRNFKIRAIKLNKKVYQDKYTDICMIIDLIHLYECQNEC